MTKGLFRAIRCSKLRQLSKILLLLSVVFSCGPVAKNDKKAVEKQQLQSALSQGSCQTNLDDWTEEERAFETSLTDLILLMFEFEITGILNVSPFWIKTKSR